MPLAQFASFAWEFYHFVAVLFMITDVILVVAFVYVFRQAWRYHPDYGEAQEHASPVAARKPTVHDLMMRERWAAIAAKFAMGTPEAARIAIIEADALVDTSLKGMQIPGDHLADRLSNLETEEIPSMGRMWRAHKLRNDLVHTPGFGISPHDAERTMRDYEAFLKDINVLE